MAQITNDEMQKFYELDLVKFADAHELHELSWQKKLRRNEAGYSAQMMWNFIKGAVCSPETKSEILSYYAEKLNKIKKALLSNERTS